MKIIFVCKHNRFRSKVAEAYFKKINKNKNISAYSRGIFKGNPVARSVLSIGKELGIKISKTPRGISEEELKKENLFIITANNVPLSLFVSRVKAIKWNIPDCSSENTKRIREIMKQIFKKVDKLVKELEKK